MTAQISPALLSQVRCLIRERTGLDFPESGTGHLAHKILTRAAQRGFAGAGAFISRILAEHGSGGEFELLIRNLTVGETYFFREKKTFEALENFVLPDLIQHRREEGTRRLKIWSAACATGEEPYSLAIVLKRLLPDLESWKVTLIASDINSSYIEKAKRGRYRDYSFRNNPSWLKERYFSAVVNGEYEISPEIKKMVSFDTINLAAPGAPPFAGGDSIDVILCRNVLIYFSRSAIKRAIKKLSGSLSKGGWLIVGASELAHIRHPALIRVAFPDAHLFRKESSIAPPAATSLPPREKLHSEITGRLSRIPYLMEKGVEKTAGTPARVRQPLPTLPTEDGNRSELEKAHQLASQGRLEEAASVCRETMKKNRLDPNLYYLMATILEEEARTDEARDMLKRTLYLDPEFALAHFALGNMYLREEKKREAKKHLDNALAILRDLDASEVVNAFEGLTANQLAETIETILHMRGMS